MLAAPSDVSNTVTLSLPDGESISIVIQWRASIRTIVIEAIPHPNNQNFFIFDVEVGVRYSQTRTIQPQPATTRDVLIGAAADISVIATKPSDDDGTLVVVVSDNTEVNTNYTYEQLFGATDSGYLAGQGDIQILDYQEFLPSAQAVLSLNHASVRPQFGLFTTSYTDLSTLVFGTRLRMPAMVLPSPDGDVWIITAKNGGTGFDFVKLT